LDERDGAAQTRRVKSKREERSSLTRQRFCIMISEKLTEDLERIYEEESRKANQQGISPLPKSRIYEGLLSRGVASYVKEQEAAQPKKQESQVAP